jgi:hypothetical protein
VTKILRDDKGNEYSDVAAFFYTTCIACGAEGSGSSVIVEPGDIVCRPVPKPVLSVEEIMSTLMARMPVYRDAGAWKEETRRLVCALIAAVERRERAREEEA